MRKHINRKFISRIGIIFATISLLVVSITGCGSSASSDAKKNTATTVRILGNVNYIPLIIASEKGFFQEAFGEGVTVDYRQSDSGSLIMETMTAGEVDLAALGDMPIVQAKANGLDVKVIGSFFQSTTGYQLIAAKDSGIETIEDLKGKKVAVMSGSTNHKLLLKYLESVGLSTDDIELVFLKNKDQLAAFVGGNVDAAVTTVPVSTKIIQETGAAEIANAEGYDNIFVFLAGSNQFVSENPELTKAFLEAIDRATTWIEENQEEAFQIAADYNGDTPENIREYYETRTFFYALGDTEKDALVDTINYLIDQGTLTKEVDVNDLVDSSYIDAVNLSNNSAN